MSAFLLTKTLKSWTIPAVRTEVSQLRSCNRIPARSAQAVLVAVAVSAALGSAAGSEPVEGQAKPGPSAADIQAAREAVKQRPADGKAHLALADLLKAAGRQREAAHEYLEVTSHEPANYMAYHQLSLLSADPSQIDEAVSRLNKLKEERPHELLLSVALSELLEKKGNYYQAARCLVDLVYQNAVPAKYHTRVNQRIHYLLAKSKDAQGDKTVAAEEDSDVLPPPLPPSAQKRDIAASKLKESRVMRGVGNAPLLP